MDCVESLMRRCLPILFLTLALAGPAQASNPDGGATDSVQLLGLGLLTILQGGLTLASGVVSLSNIGAISDGELLGASPGVGLGMGLGAMSLGALLLYQDTWDLELQGWTGAGLGAVSVGLALWAWGLPERRGPTVSATVLPVSAQQWVPGVALVGVTW